MNFKKSKTQKKISSNKKQSNRKNSICGTGRQNHRLAKPANILNQNQNIKTPKTPPPCNCTI